ncbi:glycosyltransferase family 4 protein [Microbacterium sp.]|uniref:glycosyltransferase family 4 protein n=1 Tax=Microbacterium sp. TaxID=51671 RepID=UPI003F95FF71
MSAPTVAIATNNGDIGGGEVMLLNIARALREIGFDVLVLGPMEPRDLVDEAAERGFRTLALRGSDRRGYIAALWRWRFRNRSIPLWCNGLVPSFATAGIGPRLVHLHILPTGVNAIAARIARAGARRTLVPSRFIASKVRGSTVLENWTEDVPFFDRGGGLGEPLRIGFLGRLTRDKGVHVLALAIDEVLRRFQQDVRLVLAGETRFGDMDDEDEIARALAPIEERVERLGWVSREGFFGDIDLAVYPSLGEESFGLVVAEAMAAGAPFVITDAGAFTEVAGSEHPWVARRNDSADLSRAILHALDNIRNGDERRARDARQRWRQEYSPSAGTLRVATMLGSLGTTRADR